MPSTILLRPSTSGAQAAMCLCVALMMTLLLTAGPAAAKPKKLGVDCSFSQMSKPGAQACLSKRDQDVINDVPNLHFVACLADGTAHCCQKSSAGAGYNCTSVRVGVPGDVTSPLGEATNAPVTNPSPGSVFGGAGVLHRAQ